MGILERVLTWLGIRHDNDVMPIQDAGETWYTVAEACELTHRSRQRIHMYVKDGRLITKWMGRVLVISGASLETLQSRINPPHRPKKY